MIRILIRISRLALDFYDEGSELIYFFYFSFIFTSYLAACCQGYELGERLDTVEKADVVEVGDVKETGGGVR